MKILMTFLFFLSFKIISQKRIEHTIAHLKQSPSITPQPFNQQNNEVIHKFEKQLHIKLKHCNLDYFYNNVNHLNIKLSTIPFFFRAEYNIRKNKIILTDLDDIHHELFHMASSYYNGTDFCGFSQNNFGMGINEGYTQLLTERYFQDEDSYYIAEVEIVSKLEKIIGREEMEKMYFQADLFHLISSLMEYESKDKIVDFIQAVDYISLKIDNRWKPLCKKRININLQKIYLFLLKCYVKKLQIELEKQEITEKEFYKKLSIFSKELQTISDSYEDKYVVLDQEKIEKEIKSIIKK